MAMIAVVDDVASNRELLSTVLQAIGHSTVEAADGAVALRVVREHLPDLVICDILMPVMDGYELVRELRADPVTAGTPVIFSTAHYTDREAMQLADACGVTDFLPKPTEPQQIIEVVERVLARPAAAEAAEAPEQDAFDRQHLQLMTDQLSQKVADIETAKQRLETLVDINLQLASQRNAPNLLDAVCRHARLLIGARFATLVVRSVEDGSIGHVCHSSSVPALLAGLGPCRVDAGLLGSLVDERRPLRLKAAVAKTVDLGLPAGYPLGGAVLAAPITSLASSYGWICLVNKEGAEEFSANDEQLLSILGAQTGRIYENGSLYDRVERHAKALEAQYAVAHILALADNLGTVSAGLLESICRTLHFAAGALWQVDAAKQSYRCIQVWCHESDSCDEFIDATRKLNLKNEGALPWRTWVSAEPQWIPDVARDGGFLRRRQAVAAGLHALASMPVRSRGQVTGVLELLAHRSGEPEPGLMNTLEAIADQIGQFFDSEAQRQRIVRLSRVKAVLGGIHAASAHVHTKRDLFREACRIAVEEGEFGICWIGERDADGGTVRSLAWAGVGDELGALPAAACDEASVNVSVVCSALNNAAPAIKSNLSEGVELCPRQAEALRRGYRGVIALPLSVEQAVVGVMVIYTADADSFAGEELELLTQFANDVAFTLEYIGKQDRLAFLAHHDTLTGLPNRALLSEVLAQELARPRLVKEKLAVVAFDINRFRHINYTFGRLFGDLLLRELAQRLSTAWPNPAHLAKLATDNFVGMICDVRDLKVVALMLEKVMAETFDRAFSIGGKEVQISAAAGIAIHPDDGEDAEALFRNAESALRMAKAGGRRLTFYRPEMNAMIADSLMLENRLHRALRNREFVLYYQPKVDVATRRTTSFEALIRWLDPDKGLISPDEFVPMLEETGMIHKVGSWIVRQALADSRRWTEEGVQAPRVAVNVSVSQLQQGEFMETLNAAAAARNGGSSPLDIEITESVMMSDIEGNIGRLHELRDMGLDIAIDDFGTGYSSLSYLIKLPVNSLKIDQSFVATMASSPESMTVVTTIISLAHSLGMKVVAEGVETEEQANILRLFKCDELQGYLVSPAMPADQVASFLRH